MRVHGKRILERLAQSAVRKTAEKTAEDLDGVEAKNKEFHKAKSEPSLHNFASASAPMQQYPSSPALHTLDEKYQSSPALQPLDKTQSRVSSDSLDRYNHLLAGIKRNPSLNDLVKESNQRPSQLRGSASDTALNRLGQQPGALGIPEKFDPPQHAGVPRSWLESISKKPPG